MHTPANRRARRDPCRAAIAALTIAHATALADPLPTNRLDRTLRPVVVTFTDLESVGSFLRARDGQFINGGAFVDIGLAHTVRAVSWDVTIERVDPMTTYADVSLGILNLDAGPYIRFPDDAPSFGLGGTDDWWSAQGSLWTEQVTGFIDLTTGIPHHQQDLSIEADQQGRIYFEFFESWDEDDDYGVTTIETYLGVDALVSGTVTFWVNPTPATLAPLAVATVLHRRRRAH